VFLYRHWNWNLRRRRNCKAAQAGARIPPRLVALRVQLAPAARLPAPNGQGEVPIAESTKSPAVVPVTALLVRFNCTFTVLPSVILIGSGCANGLSSEGRRRGGETHTRSCRDAVARQRIAIGAVRGVTKDPNVSRSPNLKHRRSTASE
jgi:hypothetical protein